MRRIVLGVALLLLAAGCGGGGSDNDGSGGGPKPESLDVQLQEQSFSGEAGMATLTAQGDKTKVVIAMSSMAGNAQPAHIHSGTCAKLDPTPAYPLENIVDGQSTTIVSASLADLKAKSYAINVHRSAKDLETYVACGQIAENAAPAPTYTTSDEDDRY
jgi:hypothetical protein